MKNCRLVFCILFLIFPFLVGCSQNNEDFVEEGEKDEEEIINMLDMLSPLYYSQTDNSFRKEVNHFLNFVHQVEFHHPLENEHSEIPDFAIPLHGSFGAGKGPGGTAQYHPATDMHVGNRETNVMVYAAHDGHVATIKDADKYRQYVSITKDIKNESGEMIGKLVTLYAHVDLDLDEAESLNMNGKDVAKGDIISKHLYSGTVGGPHLHFEIRYYRPTDLGDENFYGFSNPSAPNLTESSAGKWLYGVWDPKVGYGYGNPKSHGLFK